MAAEQNMKVPWFGLIHDGAPNAFTYGHHPNNMRIVITQGILDLLEPEEVEGVVAHEIGHGKNWDMLLMTVVQLVPLLLYFAYRTAMQAGGRGKDNALPDRGGRRGVCPLHRQRVHRPLVQPLPRVLRRPVRRQGDRQPQRAGLGPGEDRLRPGGARASPGRPRTRPTAKDKKGKKKKKATASAARRDRRDGDLRPQVGRGDGRELGGGRLRPVRLDADTATIAPAVSKENLKSAMQWDLWNPWATFYELNSTHPLIAHRLQYLSDQAAAMGEEPYIVFDRRKPESYWDDFAVDLAVMFLPLLLFLLGLGLAVALGGACGVRHPARRRRSWARMRVLVLVGLPILGLGIGSFIKTMLVYRGDYFAPLSVVGPAAQGEGLERPPGAGPAAGHDHRPGRPGPDLVGRLRDARQHGHPVPRLPPAAADLGVAVRAVPRRRVRGQAGRGRRLVPRGAVAVPRAEVDHGRRRDAQQLRPPRPIRLGGFAGRGRPRADRRGTAGGVTLM